MGILSWIVFPALSPDFNSDPLGAGVTRIVLLTIGLIWLFVLSLIIVRQEEGDLRWATVKRRLRLNTPRDRGEIRRRLWLWVIPFLIAIAVWELAFASRATNLWLSIFPFLAEPPGYSMAALFESQEILNRLVGAWWFFGLVVGKLSSTIWEDSISGVCFLRWRVCLAGGVGWQTARCMPSTIFTSPGGSRRRLLAASSCMHFRAGASAPLGWASSSILLRACT
jgi:hypothetical protein